MDFQETLRKHTLRVKGRKRPHDKLTPLVHQGQKPQALTCSFLSWSILPSLPMLYVQWIGLSTSSSILYFHELCFTMPTGPMHSLWPIRPLEHTLINFILRCKRSSLCRYKWIDASLPLVVIVSFEIPTRSINHELVYLKARGVVQQVKPLPAMLASLMGAGSRTGCSTSDSNLC